MKNAIIASTSTIHGGQYLEYLLPKLKILFADCKSILFIPYARPGGISHTDYTSKAALALQKIGIEVKGIHEFEYPIDAILKAEGIFVGGGNTFVLVAQLYKYQVMTALVDIVSKGIPYLGTSAGSNITGVSMQTTNDMPIVYPPSFMTLGIVPFNLNPHYLDPDLNSKHMGETRETRIKEFHAFNEIPVLGLREGSWLEVKNKKIILRGTLTARLFRKDLAAVELEINSEISL